MSSTLTYDDLVKALGGNYILGGQDMEYGSWTPNNIKSLVVAYDGVLIEYHAPQKLSLIHI